MVFSKAERMGRGPRLARAMFAMPRPARVPSPRMLCSPRKLLLGSKSLFSLLLLPSSLLPSLLPSSFCSSCWFRLSLKCAFPQDLSAIKQERRAKSWQSPEGSHSCSDKRTDFLLKTTHAKQTQNSCGLGDAEQSESQQTQDAGLTI